MSRASRRPRQWLAAVLTSATLLVIAVTPARGVFLAGRGNPRSECYVGVDVGEQSSQRVARRGTRVIQDSCGDACDFHLRMCVNSPRAGCRPAVVRDVLVIGNTGDGILTRPVLRDRAARCAAHDDVVRVELRERRQVSRRLTLIADAETPPRHDRDELTLVCRRSARACCGDGIVGAGEQCDDGNATDGDGCDSNCTPTACGNGIRDATERCDDGNLVDGDGCDSTCTPSGCGNGVVDQREQCDPPSDTPCNGCGTYCSSTCTCVERRPCACPFTDGSPSEVRLLRFTLKDSADTCGSLSDGTPLACNHLYLGGGQPNSLPDVAVPTTVSTATTATCDGTTMALSSAAGGEHCTAPGCLFGPALQLDLPPLHLCVVISVAGAVSGTLDCTSWDSALTLPLRADVFQGGAGHSPCPDCTGKTTIGECSTTGVTLLASLQLPDFSLGTTSAQHSSNDGTFCGYCRERNFGAFEGDPRRGGSGAAVRCTGDAACTNPSYPVCQQLSRGAFGNDGAQVISEDGRRPVPLGDGAPHEARLAGVFCLPPSFSETLDPNASLPGPGAVGLIGDVRLAPAPQAATCPQ